MKISVSDREVNGIAVSSAYSLSDTAKRFATRLVVPSGEDEILFGSHDTQIIRVQRSPGYENCTHIKSEQFRSYVKRSPLYSDDRVELLYKLPF